MDFLRLRRQCLALNASERILLSVRLFARMSMPPLSVVILDRLLDAGPAGMSLDDLATLLGLPAAIVLGDIDTMRTRLLETTAAPRSAGSDAAAAAPAAPPTSTNAASTAKSDDAAAAVASSLRYVVDLRKALPVVHASISLAFAQLLTLPASAVPQRLAVGLSESSATAGDRRAAVPCICCATCAMAVQTASLVGRIFCKSCGDNVGLRGAARVAEWVLHDESGATNRASRDDLPFVIPADFEADRRLCIYATMFAALFEDKFCCLSPSPVVTAASDFLTPAEKRRFMEQSGSITLRYAVPRQLRIAVCTKEELRARDEASAGGPHTSGPGKLPPWLAEGEPPSINARADGTAAPLKVHRPDLVCASQAPCAPGALSLDPDPDLDLGLDFDVSAFADAAPC